MPLGELRFLVLQRWRENGTTAEVVHGDWVRVDIRSAQGSRARSARKGGFLDSIQLVDGIALLGDFSFGGAECIALQIL